jgi:MarR family transcriptional regulator, 2-MHQ and catechol-resistance regulon repressor
MRLEEEIKTEKFESPFQRTLLNIIFTGYWIGDHESALFKPYDISVQQYNVLRILRGQKGNAINLNEIQQRMLHKSSNATRLVEKLRQKGMVERIVCEENRRKVEITITDKGLKLLEELGPKVKSMEEQLLGKLTSQEVEALGELLDKLRD